MSDHSHTGGLSRRAMLASGGALVVSFAVVPALAQQQTAPPATGQKPVPLPGSLDGARVLDAWIRIDAAGTITVNTGKAELGQGIKTALRQVAAEELDVEPHAIVLVTADTSLTPNEGYTAGSQSMQNSGTAIRHAAAQVRGLLVGEAARRFGVEPTTLSTEGKEVRAPDGRKAGYGDLAAALNLHVEAAPDTPLKKTADFKVMGREITRVDIPAKVTGGQAYIQDMRLPGMLHARVVRPPSPRATLMDVDEASIRSHPGVVAVVRDGNFLAVVCEGEYQAVKAMRALTAAARWDEKHDLPAGTPIPELLKGMEREVGTVAESGSKGLPDSGNILRARFTRPYQMHGSIGPSCGIAVLNGDEMTVWSHTQGAFPDRAAIAEMLGMPAGKVRVIHAEGAGCYGHNGADDAAADAALIARAVPGRPVRVQWMREQEHGNEPMGPAMAVEVAAALGPDGRIANWTLDVWSNTHSTRPGGAGELLAGRHMARAFQPKPAKMEITPSGNGDRNADPLYDIPNRLIQWHFLPDMPLRVSALRSLGAYVNVFSIESMMDDLAREAGKDPVAFRLEHLRDPRARAVVERAAREFGWTAGGSRAPNEGRGFAFARYKNHAAYLALAVSIRVERETGRIAVERAVAAIDSGEIVNPNGIRNQTEGGILQSMSWTLFEEATFDDTRITSIDWASYPILRFASVPKSVQVHIIDRPGEPFLGTGEAAQGPTAGALGNAVRDAVGVRLHDLPFSRARVRAALSA